MESSITFEGGDGSQEAEAYLASMAQDAEANEQWDAYVPSQTRAPGEAPADFSGALSSDGSLDALA